MKQILTTLIGVLLTFVSASSQSKSTGVTPKAESAQPVQNTNEIILDAYKVDSLKRKVASNSSELALYKLLYENASKANDKYISLTQWTLGITLTIIIAVIGSQIFFNYRLNNEKIRSLKSELDEQLAQFRLEITQASNEEMNRASNRQDERVSALEARLKEYYKNRAARMSRLSELHLEAQKREIDSDLKDLKIDVEKSRGDIWALKGVKSNALTNYITTALLLIEKNREEKYLLDDIIELLNNLDEVSKSDYDAINDLVSKIRPVNKSQRDNIEKAIANKPVYQYEQRKGRIGFLDYSTIPSIFNYMKVYIKNAPN